MKIKELELDDGQNKLFVEEKLDEDLELGLSIWQEGKYTNVYLSKNKIELLIEHLNKIL